MMIKIKNGGEQEKKGNGIVDQVIEIGMNERARDDANQAADAAWKNSQIIRFKAVSNLI